jgi:hypothetical protein
MNSIMMKRKGIIKREEEEEEKDGTNLSQCSPPNIPPLMDSTLRKEEEDFCLHLRNEKLPGRKKKGARPTMAPHLPRCSSQSGHTSSLLFLMGGYVNGKESQEEEQQQQQQRDNKPRERDPETLFDWKKGEGGKTGVRENNWTGGVRYSG